MQQASTKVRHARLRKAVAVSREHFFTSTQTIPGTEGAPSVSIPQLRIRDHKSGVSSVDCLNCGRALIVKPNGSEVFGSAEGSECR